jgi:hypothetical protein
MAPGADGIPVEIVTGILVIALVPQVLLAVTVIFPLTAVDDVETVIKAEPCPDVIVHPVGTAHV